MLTPNSRPGKVRGTCYSRYDSLDCGDVGTVTSVIAVSVPRLASQPCTIFTRSNTVCGYLVTDHSWVSRLKSMDMDV
jgi:hypothetical protein